MDIRCKQRTGRVRQEVPDSYFLNYFSTKCHVSESAWVVCQFAKDSVAENLLAVGDENGLIHFLDVQKSIRKGQIQADRSCVIDVSFVPNRPNDLLSISGHAKVTLWDIEKQQALQQFVGHEGSVRALSISDTNSNVFATGARDGTICIWDRREKYKSQSQDVHPYSVLEMTHPLMTPERQSIGTKRRSRTSFLANSKGITSLVHLGSNTLISASTSFKTGIRFWDLRYRGKTGPFRILEDPNKISARDFGIASMCLDRSSSTLFAASTDSKVYQYSIQGSLNIPVGILQGVKRMSFNTYDFRIAASPVSDHVMFGGGDCFAVIWDLQEFYSGHSRYKMNYLPYPKYTFGGHRFEVTVARFSATGHYIATMDDSFLKIWEWNARLWDNHESSPTAVIHQDHVELYELPGTFRAENSMKQLSVSASTVKKAECSTPKKDLQRSPFKNPFKSPINRYNEDEKRENGSESPEKKILRTTESPPFYDQTNKSSHGAARKLDFSGSKNIKERVTCAFHYKYPTMNLPNFVKDGFRLSNFITNSQKTIGAMNEGEENVDHDEFSSSLNRPSNCSNIISMEERVEHTSPRKILVKQCSHNSRERVSRLLTLCPGVDSASCGTRQSRLQDHSAVVGQETPKSTKQTRTQRTLDQYFSKAPRTC